MSRLRRRDSGMGDGDDEGWPAGVRDDRRGERGESSGAGGRGGRSSAAQSSEGVAMHSATHAAHHTHQHAMRAHESHSSRQHRAPRGAHDGGGGAGEGARAELAKKVNALFAWAFEAVVVENVLCHKEWAEEVYGELMAAVITGGHEASRGGPSVLRAQRTVFADGSNRAPRNHPPGPLQPSRGSRPLRSPPSPPRSPEAIEEMDLDPHPPPGDHVNGQQGDGHRPRERGAVAGDEQGGQRGEQAGDDDDQQQQPPGGHEEDHPMSPPTPPPNSPEAMDMNIDPPSPGQEGAGQDDHDAADGEQQQQQHQLMDEVDELPHNGFEDHRDADKDSGGGEAAESPDDKNGGQPDMDPHNDGVDGEGGEGQEAGRGGGGLA
ncbi:unnamed protein product [Vitrella brassicaformis CCMP3155]|uniref:Uncharacterized protein n=1 Tax=Vitrella brassicaformis (strain CCMP3155) TaxID=1169540 RepID=A0A0G4FWJ8_VITBC|nr:unnamed protein product [Vitrella brassicaformis CCMP3155]|eukprot:CEM19231.1 unnamed protein product [Vitrella brassicaformis CCMP3155]